MFSGGTKWTKPEIPLGIFWPRPFYTSKTTVCIVWGTQYSLVNSTYWHTGMLHRYAERASSL